MQDIQGGQLADEHGWKMPPEQLAAMTRIVMEQSDRQRTPDGRTATCGLVRYSGPDKKSVSVTGSDGFPALLSKLLDTTLTLPVADHEVVVFWVRPRAHVEELRLLIGRDDLPRLPRRLTIAVGVEGRSSSGGSGVVLTSVPPGRLNGFDATYRALMETAIGFRKALERP